MENEIRLVVKADSYKAFKNFVHNELKIDKPTFEKMVGDYVAAYMSGVMVEQKFTELLDKRIDATLGKTNDWRDRSKPLHTRIQVRVDEMVAKAIDSELKAAIKVMVEEKVREKLSTINI
jgi:hypothetical protein